MWFGYFPASNVPGQGLLCALGWVREIQNCSREDMNSQKAVKEPVLYYGCETPRCSQGSRGIHGREYIGFP